jgi:hypothetical protein
VPKIIWIIEAVEPKKGRDREMVEKKGVGVHARNIIET